MCALRHGYKEDEQWSSIFAFEYYGFPRCARNDTPNYIANVIAKAERLWQSVSFLNNKEERINKKGTC